MIIHRTIKQSLFEHLEAEEITLLIGSRQTGKTLLMKLMREHLVKENKPTLFFSLDYQTDMRYFASHDTLLNKIRLENPDKQKIYIFIDEIQRLPDAGLFLKGLYDHEKNFKLIVSGSGSLELKEKIHESLAGRKRIFEVTPISFYEFSDFQTGYRYSGRLIEFFNIEKDSTLKLLNEYLNWGGYPRVVLETKDSNKRLILDDISGSIIEKDIYYLISEAKRNSFPKFIQLIASRIGAITNHAEIATLCGISVSLLKDFFWYAEKTFLVRAILPFYNNPHKEITKSPIYYFEDLGLRNFVFGISGLEKSPSELSFLFQNFVYLQLKELVHQTGITIKFWRTTSQAEVDFILQVGTETIPIEVKYSTMKEPKVTRSFHSYIDKYQPRIGYIVNLSLSDKIEVHGTTIRFIRFDEIKNILPHISLSDD